MTERILDVLLVIEEEIATTHLIERMLLACEVHGVRYRKRLLRSLKVSDFKQETIPLFVRCGDPSVVIWVKFLVQSNKPYLYYIDDNFWKLNGHSLVELYYQHPLIRRSLELIIRNAKGVLTNSNELASYLERFNKNTCVLPAFFDFSLIDGQVRKVTNEVRIGFAGSPTRIDDLEIIRPIINTILEKYPEVVFEFCGVMPRGIESGKRIRYFHHMDSYEEFIKFQKGRSWAIGLAPLADTESNRCKTNNKYREYGACEIAGVYSSLPPYTESIKDGITGMLVENSMSAWSGALFYLLNNPIKCKNIGINASIDVRDKHCIESVASSWALVFKAIAEQLDVSLHESLCLRFVSFYGVKIFKYRMLAISVHLMNLYRTGGMLLVSKKLIERLNRFFKPDSSAGNVDQR